MIVQIGLALALIAGAVLFGLQGQQIATGVLGQVMAPIMSTLQGTILMLAHLAPILVMALPPYLVFRDEGEATPTALTWGAVYGVLLFALVQYTGIDLRLVQAVQQSFTGSLVGGLGVLAQFTWGILAVATYYLAGVLLAVASVVLEVVSGIGRGAGFVQGYVHRAEESILARILRRLRE